MDFITELPGSPSTVLVVVDRFSKMCHLSLLNEDTTAATVADVFMRDIVRLHGFPQSIVSDRDPRFTSRFWQELMKLMRTSVKLSTAYHPQTDGQSERMIRSVEQVLRAYCVNQPETWQQYLA